MYEIGFGTTDNTKPTLWETRLGWYTEQDLVRECTRFCRNSAFRYAILMFSNTIACSVHTMDGDLVIRRFFIPTKSTD